MEEQVHKAVYLQLPRSKQIDIEFNDISVSVPNGRKGNKNILNGLSGKFLCGELTAIMGPSGAGKTSLLNILTGFQCNGMKGSIRSSNNKSKKEGAKQYKKDSCYILQDDQLVPYFTVSEIMKMAVDLKLGHSLSKKAKHFLIDDILDTLGLSKCKDTRCGRLSMGQKKRLSISLELVDNPPVMFLDEPTTGLDSSSSHQCVSMLKALARGGRTIVCTIHQPSARIYEMFDQVYVMADGKCIYQGASTNTVAYLSAIGLNCPEYHNPADYLLEVANGEYGNLTDQLVKASSEKNWRSVYTAPKTDIEELAPSNEASKEFTDNTDVEVVKSSELNKFCILLRRSMLQLYRDWTVTHLKLLLHTFTGIFIGMFYFNIGNDASKTIVNLGYLTVTLVYLCFTSIMPAVLKYPSELPVLKKERFNNWYKLKTYYFANMITGIPIQMLFCSSYTAISYFMSSQPPEWDRFLMFLGICCLVTITAESYGIFLGTTVNPINGTFLASIAVAVVMLFCGFFILFVHMTKLFYFISYISYLRYSMQGLIYAVYGNNRGSIPCPEEVIYCHYTTPDVFLKEIGFSDNSYWLNFAVLCGMIIVLRVITFCTLRKRLSVG